MKIPFYLFLFMPGILIAQGHQPVFPHLTGEDLIMQLQAFYTPDSVLPYDMARDTLFKNIDSVNDTLYGVYTRHSVYLPPDEDPTIAAFMNGSSNGINTEHSWPRSKGASSGNAESDMHHLYPTRTPVNSDRASLPFGEVNDFSTQKWYIYNRVENQIPNRNIDQYSELGSDHFEPREAFKGDIARSMFYFYTLYRQEAEAADPLFFNIQRTDLCAWHLEDEVDSTEWERTHQIAAYQSGKMNPFILDCSLAFRSYCQDFTECDAVNSSAYESTSIKFQVYPNPASDLLIVDPNELNLGEDQFISILNLLGEVILPPTHMSSKKVISVSHLAEGVYFVRLSSEGKSSIKKLILSRP